MDKTLVQQIVRNFYARIRADKLLGPIFNAAIHDWPQHLDKLVEFWASVILMTGTYKGNPLQVHLRIPDLDDEHFRRWLQLFSATLDDYCTIPQRELFLTRACRIADSLRFGIAMSRGELARPLSSIRDE